MYRFLYITDARYWKLGNNIYKICNAKHNTLLAAHSPIRFSSMPIALAVETQHGLGTFKLTALYQANFTVFGNTSIYKSREELEWATATYWNTVMSLAWILWNPQTWSSQIAALGLRKRLGETGSRVRRPHTSGGGTSTRRLPLIGWCTVHFDKVYLLPIFVTG